MKYVIALLIVLIKLLHSLEKRERKYVFSFLVLLLKVHNRL